MKNTKTFLIFLFVFLAACLLAVQFEDSYHELIRYLYVRLSSGTISFRHPGKQFSFPDVFFVGFFGVFATVTYYLLSKLKAEAIVIHLFVALILFAAFTAWGCKWDGFMKVMVCTACNDGKRTLYYNDVNYNKQFATGLIAALLPLLIVEYKRRKKKTTL